MQRYIFNEHNYKQDIAEFGNNLRSLRESAGLSLDDLARMLESDKSPLSKIENGGRIPRLDMVFRIMDSLRVPPEVLVPARFMINQTDIEWRHLSTLYSQLPADEKETAVRYIRALLVGILATNENHP